MKFKDEPAEVCRYDLMAFASEAKAYASQWDSEYSFLENATLEQLEYLLHLVTGAGEAVAQLLRAKENIPDHWLELRSARNQSSHVFSNRLHGEAWRLSSGLLAEIASELSRELPPIPDYDRQDTHRSRHFSNDAKN